MINWIIIFHLLVTLLFELIIYGIGDKFKMKSMLAMYVGNILLNSTMNLVATSLTDKTAYLIFIICYEVFTFVTEAFLFYLFTSKKLWYCFLIAFAANMLSLAIGNVFNATGVIYKNDVVITLVVIFAVLVSLQITLSVILFLRPLFRTIYNQGDKARGDK